MLACLSYPVWNSSRSLKSDVFPPSTVNSRKESSLVRVKLVVARQRGSGQPGCVPLVRSPPWRSITVREVCTEDIQVSSRPWSLGAYREGGREGGGGVTTKH